MTHLTALVADANIEYQSDIEDAISSREQNRVLEEQNRMLERLIELLEK